MKPLLPLALVLCSGVLGGCSSEDDTGATTSNVNQCDSSEVSYADYASGITASGEKSTMKVTVLDAAPAPPSRGSNSWTLQLTDADGAPLPNGSIESVVPFMPDHGHGTGIMPVISALDAEGKATVSDIDFMMAGVWTVTIKVNDGTSSDDVVFAFCIDG